MVHPLWCDVVQIMWMDKKKLSKTSLYTIFKVRGCSTPFKMKHIWDYLEQPFEDEFAEEMKLYNVEKEKNVKCALPPLVVINFMIPNYSPGRGKKATNDGAGYSLVIYSHLSAATLQQLDELIKNKSEKDKELPLSAAIKLLCRFIEDPQLQKERFKVIPRTLNGKHSKLGFVANQLLKKYNSKPFLARTSTTYYHEPGKYFGIDIDVHSFSFAARKGLDIFKESLTTLIYDFGFVIQGQHNSQLPEQMLMAVRISKLPSTVLCQDMAKDKIQKYLNENNANKT
eukprot:149748_1